MQAFAVEGLAEAPACVATAEGFEAGDALVVGPGAGAFFLAFGFNAVGAGAGAGNVFCG